MKRKLTAFAILFALLATQTPTTAYAATNADVKMIVDGEAHAAILKTDNSLWLCGDNHYGQLGVTLENDASSTETAVKVLSGVKAVATGKNSTAAVKTDGTLLVWGYNNYGQLGIPNPNNKELDLKAPTQLMSGVKNVVAGEDFMVALKTDGSVWTWGSGSYHQLGINTESELAIARIIPVDAKKPWVVKGVPVYKPIKILEDGKAISAGEHAAAVVRNDGSLLVWGNNSPYNQLGIDTRGGYVSRPTKVVESGVKAVAVSDRTMAYIKTNGDLYMCGDCSEGQLGIGTKDTVGDRITRSEAPVKVLSGAKAVAVNEFTTLVLKTDGSLWVCGSYKGTKVLTPKQIMTDVASLCVGANRVIKEDDTFKNIN